MNISVFAFVVFLGAVLMLLAVEKETGLTTAGDTSLGRNSVNWMGAIALAGALVICLFLD